MPQDEKYPYRYQVSEYEESLSCEMLSRPTVMSEIVLLFALAKLTKRSDKLF